MIILIGAAIGILGLAVAAWTDRKEYRIPNQLMAWMFAIGIVFATWRFLHPASARIEYLWGPVWMSCLLGLGIAFLMFVMRVAYDTIRERLKKEPKVLFGGGDMKLLAVASFFFPYNAYVLILLVACLMICVIEPMRYFVRKKKHFAFAPYVFVSSVVIIAFAALNIFGHSS